MITKIDRNTVKVLRQDLEAAIAEVCKKHGLKRTTLGNITFDSINNTMTTAKLEFAPMNPDLVNISTKPASDFVGRRFKMGGRTFTILKNDGGTLIGETQRGKRYKIRIEQLADMIEVKN